MRRLYKYILLSILLCFGYSSEALTRDPLDGYYLISSVEDYRALADDETMWNGNYKFKQIADLDFQGQTIPQIGRRNAAFKGVYDGQGCKITNGVLYWNPVIVKGTQKEVAFGLFRYVNGAASKLATVKNLTVSDVRLTITYSMAPEGTTFNNVGDTDDVKLGILVGALGQYSTIENICINDCSIDDGNLSTIKPHGIFVGGAIGDVNVNYGGTTIMSEKNFQIKSINSNVNIDLRNLDNGRLDQFQAYAGGIVGRIRFPEDMGFIPSETLYSGKIIFPIGFESPTVGSMRVRGITNKNNDPTLIATYAGEFGSTTSDNSTVYDSFINNGVFNTQAYDAFCKKRRFYNYSAWNSNSNTLEQITATNPTDDVSLYLFGTRTFLPNKAFKALSASDLKNNAQLQGVNYGYLTNPSTQEADIIDMLNSGTNETYEDQGMEKKKYVWRKSGSDKFEMVRNFYGDWYELEVAINQATGDYQAKIYFKHINTEFVPGPDLPFQWYYTTSIKNGDWVVIADGVTNTMAPEKGKYYKVKWTSSDGMVYESDYLAPARTIYVFNPASNDEFNDDFTLDYNEDESALPVYKLDTALYPNAGDDENDGLSPGKAVLTMKRAYQLLDEDGDELSNRIVVMGYYVDDNFLKTNYVNTTPYKKQFINNSNTLPPYAKPATITGTDNDEIFNGILGLKREPMDKGQLALDANGDPKAEDYYIYMTAPVRFDNIDIMRHWCWRENSGSTKYGNTLFWVCNYFDLTIDKNVRFVNLLPHATGYGLPEDITSVPYFTLIGGTQNWNFDCETEPLLYPCDLFPGRKNFYAEEGRVNINISSGVYGRLICSGRNTNTVWDNSHNITGSYKTPSRVKLNINIKDDIDFDKPGQQYSRYGVDVAYDTETEKFYFISANFSHNVGLISGGQTDGTTYGDIEMNIFAGYIGRVITSNITYGRLIEKTEKIDGVEIKTELQYPTDSFYGRSILNIYGKTIFEDATGKVWSETTINEVFGGILGRVPDATRVCRPYFYGQSYVNMYGGFVGPYLGDVDPNDTRGLKQLKTISPSIYGAGAGGVAGLSERTSDKAIPFLVGEDIVYGKYEDYSDNYQMPQMRMFDKKMVDLNQTECFVNLYGGIVQGNVFGAGFGYSNNIPYERSTLYQKCPTDLGALYGNSYVSMLKHPDYQAPRVLGNVYGSGAGDSRYTLKWDQDHKDLADDDIEKTRYRNVAAQYGDATVTLHAGTVGDFVRGTGGDVFGGAMGIAGFEDIAALYGNTELEIDGAMVYGNIYAGSELANIRKVSAGDPNSGNTKVTISSGTIGNNIFGGSRGVDTKKEPAAQKDSKAIIEGNSYVNINGGDFFGYQYIKYNQEPVVDGKPINIVTHRHLYRTFNIYGGGYLNCDIKGDANVNVLSSLLCSENSFPLPEENANGVICQTQDTPQHSKRFHSAYMDLTYRSFCVYGGGYGEKTNVLNTNVYVKIPEDRPNVTLPHGYTLQRFLDHQSFFDIAGGGYAGDVGYWANVDGIPVSEIPEPTIADLPLTAEEMGTLTEREKDIKLDNYKATMYDHYVGGNCRVIIDGYTYTRKIIGGGFYGSCRNTNTHVRCGSLRQVYGGSLLGYVYDRAYLQFGNRIEDFIHASPNGSGGYTYSYDGSGVYDFTCSVQDVIDTPIWKDAAYRAKELNQYIYITENIYGGNDVKGIIGTEKWTSPEGNYGIDHTDNGPLYRTDVTETEQKGIVFNIYGGTFMGDVYSAGNGHYRGYYVPEWVRYDDGPDRMYRTVHSSVDPNKTAKAYRSRPMVGSVNVNLRGNSPDDYITIVGNFFGGGRECSIGQYNTFLPLEDPRRLVKGGHLAVNMGGHVHIGGNVYLGSEGSLYSQQLPLPSDVDVMSFNGSTTSELARIGDTAYEHWYYNTNLKRYVPGFPAPGEIDGNFGMTGEHMLRGYMKNIEMEGDVSLTFYRYLYERDAQGAYKYVTDSKGNEVMTSDGERIRLRKSWVPGELAMKDYDATDIRMKSFYLGGLCGSMTNNNVMIYDYTEGKSFDEENASKIPATNDKEAWGSVYRVTLPGGVTVCENVVMGSENATIKTHDYESDYHALAQGKPMYIDEGGIVTHSGYSFDLIVYNDIYHNSTQDNAPWRDLPDDFYSSKDIYVTSEGDNIYDLDQYAHSSGNVLYRKNYGTKAEVDAQGNILTEGNFLSDFSVAGYTISEKRFGLAVTKDTNGKPSAYIGRREQRRLTGTATGVPTEYQNKMTVTKLTLGCQFEQLGDPKNLSSLYGGNIYGGCYNSGIVIGDVVMNIGSNLLSSAFDDADDAILSEHSDLKYNIGRVFGGGFGSQTRIDGDTYINLVRNFKGMNVFGGGMEGDVTGVTNINYIGAEKHSMIYGSIYGGGLRGAVGTPVYPDPGSSDTSVTALYEQATSVRLFSGNVKAVYGGSCMGELYGRTFVELCDEAITDISHFDYQRFLRYNSDLEDWGGSRLVIGNVFGGNDIAGKIHPHKDAIVPPASFTPSSVEEHFKYFTTGVYIHETKEKPSASAPSHKNTPGAKNGYNGFPLVGNLYGGSNGSYGRHDSNHLYYSQGRKEIATGIGNQTKSISLNGLYEDPEECTEALAVPNVVSAHIMLEGGSVINGYSGGDMATITYKTRISVNYPEDAMEARAGFLTTEELDRVWSVLDLSFDEQRSEVTELNEDGQPIFDFQIFRLFGGNNNADMALQPEWRLNRGYVGSLYSGGNFGKMTYFDQDNIEGLTLTIDSPDMHIDYVYGGGRVGDIQPSIPPTFTTGLDNFYGATLNIKRGIIDHVYGGNDVSGYIYNGTNVNITGAISGDVYCAGNGNYFYKYDRRGNNDLIDYSNPKIAEAYQSSNPNYPGTRYFVLPAKAAYGFNGDPYDSGTNTGYNATDAQTVMAINSYRPHVERAKLTIEGTSVNEVWVRGKVYCGGNSASIVPKLGTSDYDVKFNIGSYVTLNGVYMGSNGESLSLGETIERTEVLNGIDGQNLSMIAENDLDLSRNILPDSDKDVVDNPLYPNILDLYMRAVEVVDKPEFQFSSTPSTPLTRAFIGEFCLGGNRGSMMTDKRIQLEFPSDLTIFGKIIGGCMDANVTYKGVTHVTYKGVTHIGGLTQPLDTEDPQYNGEKVNLKVRSKFVPMFINYPDTRVIPPISVQSNFVDGDGNSIMVKNPDQTSTDNSYIIDPTYTGKLYYPDGQCNIYGGCLTSGTTVGGISLDVYSDMLNYDGDDTSYNIDKDAVHNGIVDTRSWRSFTIVGAGYGANTAVIGNVSVRMLPSKVNGNVTHPSTASIFGGSQDGLVVGNTNVEIRDGKVFTNVYGASEAAKMYGSTSVIIGYPRYYRALKTGHYRINRADYMSDASNNDLKDAFGEIVVPKTLAYLKGEIIPQNIYEMMLGRIQDTRIEAVIDNDNFVVGKMVDDVYVDAFDDDQAQPAHPITNYFTPVRSSKIDPHTNDYYEYIVPADFDAEWDDIEIWVGDQESNRDSTKKFYGQGNVYGGGYVSASSSVSLVGQPTVMRYTSEYNLGIPEEYASLTDDKLKAKLIALYGGNTAVMIWDDENNADYTKTDVKNHVHIGTGQFKKVEIPAGSDPSHFTKNGYYEKIIRNDGNKDIETYIYQTSGAMEAGKEYYEKVADGGVYGEGRKVFAQAFRSIDLAYYGYGSDCFYEGNTLKKIEHSPQNPKLLNTIQRADVVTIKDCCIDFIGASDFTVEELTNELYAINRVSELRMYSSLNPDSNLDGGWIAADDHDGVRLHTMPRSRNYIGLYNKTNHLGAFYSNWSFEKKYHLSDGTVTSEDEQVDKVDPVTSQDILYGYPNDGKVSYVNRKHRFVDLYTPFYNYKKSIDKGTQALSEDSIIYYKDKYLAFTHGTTFDLSGSLPERLEALTQAYEKEFRKRNVATSGNMIGISSGYELRFEGLACPEGSNEESMYYGPAYGVTEIKILTTVSGMGGGYVYALNHHRDPKIDGGQLGTETQGWCSKFNGGKQDFLQTSGNFVFPGASYQTSTDGETGTSPIYNYIVDDCYYPENPVKHGYFTCEHQPSNNTALSRAAEDGENGESGESGESGETSGESGETSGESGETSGAAGRNINNVHEVHYWYVTGTRYAYNLTVTGITADPTEQTPSRNFWLPNDNEIINLFNIKEGTKIRVNKVTWYEHPTSEIASTDKCDISDLEKQYQLYLTVDHNTRNTLTDQSSSDDKNGAYVVRVPRFNYELKKDAGGNYINKNYDPTALDAKETPKDYAFSSEGAQVDPNPTGKDFIFNGKYTNDKNELVSNAPLLGIRLVDGQKNRLSDGEPEDGMNYYNRYLRPTHSLQVEIETQNGEDYPIIYELNIDIKYVIGPALFGKIQIENCALPGEYIYVNADNVQVVMDDNLGVTKQMWKLYPNYTSGENAGKRYANPEYPATDKDPNIYVDLSGEKYTVPSSDRLIHIPAYYYMDGWEVAYVVMVNEEQFESTLPYSQKKTVTDPDDEDKTIEIVEPIEENRLHVHNYHRMKPVYNGKVLDLRLVQGARIYLESEEDMKYFFEYLDMMQYCDADLKDPKINDLYTRFTLPDGRVVNPQYCLNLDFFQQEHLTVPTKAEFTQKNTELDFRGNYHGNGRWMQIPSGADINIANGVGGNMYNTGFVSSVNSEGTQIYDRNDGTITNCFYFNEYGKGVLTKTGTLRNCYQNTTVQGGPTASEKFKYNELLKLSTMGFRYGHAAYNLNGFYLHKRHLLLHEEGARAANNSYSLSEMDKTLRALQPTNSASGVDDPYQKYSVPYIEWMFNNGDYRYAFYRNQLTGFGSQFTEALRTAETPNYFDGLNQRSNGLPVSMHNYNETEHKYEHTIDLQRWCENHKVYHPLFDTDYLFFGENLSVDADDPSNKHLPELYTPETRVYRVGGFYGSAVDKGFFMNKEAYVDSPQLTALDFVGYRDQALYSSPGVLKSDVSESLTQTGWWIMNEDADPGSTKIDQYQEIFMPPTIDVPWVGKADGHAEFNSFRINSDKVTHNLLMYTHDNDHVKGVMDQYHYPDKTLYLGKTLHSYAEHEESEVMAHHILENLNNPTSKPKAYGGMLHLVDAHDFNAPIAFEAQEAWYTRQPHDYADEYTVTTSEGTTYGYKTAWEGICLPYDVHMTYASSTEPTYMSDMGEITHFFDKEQKGHEYWLRRYVGVNTDNAHLNFERPTEENKGAAIETTKDYIYSNPTFYNMYKEFGYNADHDHLYHNEDNPGKPLDLKRTIKNYRYLSHNTPYVVTFPGERYYEFDLSGEFYFKKNDKVPHAVSQSITYFANGDLTSETPITIPITDATHMVDYSKDGYTMHGTFKHITNDATLTQNVLYDEVSNLMVLDACEVVSGKVQDEIHIGEQFESAAKFGTSNSASSTSTDPNPVVVLPFRVYMTTNPSNTQAPMRIGSRSIIQQEEILQEEEPEQVPDTIDPEQEGIKVWVEGQKLVIKTPYELTTTIFDMAGRPVRHIKAYEGVNRYSGLEQGFYIVLRTKFAIL